MLKRKTKGTAVLNLRDLPRSLVSRIKAAAALQHQPLKQYVAGLLQHHLEELERKGVLPKSK